MRSIFRSILIYAFIGGFIPQVAYPQNSSLLEQFTVEGRLYSAGNPMTGIVKVKLEVIDQSNMSCVLYRETQELNLNSTTGAAGIFAIPLGAGTDVLPGANSLSRVFANGISQRGDLDGDNVIDTGASPAGCDFVPADASFRFVRVNVSTDNGNSYVTLSPDTKVTAAPTAMVANSLQGLGKDAFIRVNNVSGMSLTQTSADYVFSTTNLQRLSQLLAPTSSVSFGSQRLTDVGTPTAGSDATNKNYVDTRIAGHQVDATSLSAPLSGQVLTWSGGQWVAQTLSTADSTKLPLAGGTMTGVLNMGTSPFKLAGVPYSGESSLGLVGAAQAGSMWFDTSNNVVRFYNGIEGLNLAHLSSTGKLNIGMLPNSTVTAGSYGTGTHVPVITVDMYGRVTAASTQPISVADSTKLPLAGGTMTGALDMGSNPLNSVTNMTMSGHLLMGSNRMLKLPTVTDASQNTIGIGVSYPGALVFNSTSKTLKVHDGTNYITQAYLDISGKLDSSLLPAGVVGTGTTAAGDLAGTYPNPTIANNRITPSKLFTTDTIGVNQLVMSGPTTGGSAFQFKYCDPEQILKYAGTGWICTSMPITALTGDIAASGSGSVTATIQPGRVDTAKLADSAVTDAKILDVNVGKVVNAAGSYFHYKPNGTACVADELLKWNDGAEQWECVSPGSLTGLNAQYLRSIPISTTPPSTGKIMFYNGSAWTPSVHLLRDSGSESAPQLAFSGSSNGVYYTSGQISLAAGGASRITALNSGNVGVGTTSPAANLHVASSTAAATTIFVSNTTGGGRTFSLRVTGTADSSGPGAFSLYDQNAATERIRITRDGDIGVGVPDPRAKLEVNGAIISAPSTLAGTAVDFSKGNIQHVTNCAVTLNNMKDGGSYMLAVKGTTSQTCTFTAYSGIGPTGPLTIYYPPNYGTTIANTHTIYNFAVAGNDVYVSWTPGYTP